MISVGDKVTGTTNLRGLLPTFITKESAQFLLDVSENKDVIPLPPQKEVFSPVCFSFILLSFIDIKRFKIFKLSFLF